MSDVNQTKTERAARQVSIVNEVLSERERQDNKWGEGRKLNGFIWRTILGEEAGEVDRALLESNSQNYREELIQVAAVAIAAIECCDEFGIMCNSSGKNQ